MNLLHILKSSFLEADKDLPDFTHFGQSQLNHQDNFLSEALLNDSKSCEI